MAAPFSTSEKDAIRAALLAAGLEQFSKHGIGRARIDDICKQVGISKGSFYAFFPSKEDLFMAIGDDQRAGHMNTLFALLEDMDGEPKARVGRLFDSLIAMMESNTLLQIISDQGDMARLKRKMTPERLAEDQEAGDAFYGRITTLWNEREFGTPLETGLFADMMTLIATLTLQQRNFPLEPYNSAKKLLRDLFVARLAGDQS